MKLTPMKKRKDFKNCKSNLKVKDKNKNIKKESLHAKEKLRLSKKLKRIIDKSLKNLNSQSLNQLQLLFNFSLSSPNFSMDFAKTNVLIARDKTKLLKKKVQAKSS